ncbi:MAG: aminotransferase class IV, partial [Flavobacteriaceae bacterium]|nr:aminotransferase class IV [Flavobacteriaceae bacterium]
IMIGFYNENYTDIGHLSLPICSTTINRSYAAFEFFTLVNHKPFYLDRHLNRLFQTLDILRIRLDYDNNKLIEIIQQLILQNPTENISYKIFVIPEPISNFDFFKADLFIFPIINPLKEPISFKTGAKLLLKAYSRFLPEAKTTNYTAYVYWENEVQHQQAIDVLYFDANFIKETSRSNIFIVKNNTIYTPKKSVLKGITRSITIDLIQKNKQNFIEKEITVDELLLADEVFVTSTTREIMPISLIDATLINQGKIGKITQQLMTDFITLKNNY